MEPFRSAPPTCARCEAFRADHMGLQGEPLCRGCALGTGIQERLERGRRSSRAGAVAAILFGGAVLLGIIGFAVRALGKLPLRPAALVGGMALVFVIWGIRDLRVLRR